MNSLDLHLEGEAYYPYRLIQGKVQELLLNLRAKHLSPIGTAHFCRRLEEVRDYPDVFKEWSNLCPVLGDVMAKLPEYPFGSAKIIRGNIRLWDYLSKAKVVDGVVELSDKQYRSLEGLLIPGISLRRDTRSERLKEDIFSYLEIPSEDRNFMFPKRREYPYLTLLAFSNSAKILGSCRLDDYATMIAVR